jgi:hypothetical protein
MNVKRIWTTVLLTVIVVVAMTNGTLWAKKHHKKKPHVITKPFKISGGGEAGYFPFPGLPPTTYFADGTATQLGRYHADGAFQFDTVDFATLTGTFSSGETPTVFTGANGDQLVCDFAGTFSVIPQEDGTFVGVFVATFTPVFAQNTGKFKRIIGGSFEMIATTEAFESFEDTDIPYTWEGDGAFLWKKK